MQLNNFIRLSLTRKRTLLIVASLISWATLIALWMINTPNVSTSDQLYQLVSTLQSPTFSETFGLPFIVIMTLLLLDNPTVPALYRLQTSNVLRSFILRTSFMLTCINIIGCSLSLCILCIFTKHVNLDPANLFVGSLLLGLYWLGCFIIATILITVSICYKKLTALFTLIILMMLDNTLLRTFGINLFLHRGLSWANPTYDYQLLINLALYIFYVILICNNLTLVLKKTLTRN